MSVRRATQAQTVCAVCAVPLSEATRLDGDKVVATWWEHPLHLQVDHRPVPVVAADNLTAEGVCDFCGEPGPEWGYQCDDIPVGVDVTTGDIHYSKGAWAACQFCAALIDADDAESLLERAITIMQARRGVALHHAYRTGVALLYAQFFLHRRGVREPLR